MSRVLASACLPFLSQAVKIDGEYFWDGGYMRNPALFPLIYNCESRDIIVIHINPTERLEIPRTAPEIMSRINEISLSVGSERTGGLTHISPALASNSTVDIREKYL